MRFKGIKVFNLEKIMRVFIADDSAVLRKHLIRVLSAFENLEIVGEAKDSLQAVEYIRNLRPDVVILDIRMPGSSGIDVLQAIKKDKAPPLFIVFTNYPYPQYRRKCLEAGAEYFFDKSTESEKMIEVLEQLTENFSRAQQSKNGDENKL